MSNLMIMQISKSSEQLKHIKFNQNVRKDLFLFGKVIGDPSNSLRIVFSDKIQVDFIFLYKGMSKEREEYISIFTVEEVMLQMNDVGMD